MSDNTLPRKLFVDGPTVFFSNGGFDIRFCPNPEALADEMAKRYNSHDRLVEALRACVDDLAKENIESHAARGACHLLSEIEGDAK